MAINDNLENQKKAIEDLNKEYQLLNENIAGIAGKIAEATSNTDFLDDATKRVANKFKNDLTAATNNLIKNNRELVILQTKQLNGVKLDAAEQRKLNKLQERANKDRKQAEEALNNLRLQGVDITAETELELDDLIQSSETLGTTVAQTNTNLVAQRGIVGNLADSAKEYLISLDKSGLAAIVLNGELNNSQKLALASEAAFLAIVKSTFTASDNINNLQKNLGISYGSAQGLQLQLAITAANSEKLFITSQKLNESFIELTKQTGLVADFGGETLVTFTTLKNQLGLSAEEAGKLTLLSRIQGKNTEGILDNTVKTVSSLVKQNRVGINVKAVLNDVANVSDAIAVSLGKSPEKIAEAATEARIFGSNLSQVDAIANSLLNFEQSIANELQAELLTGKELNLEKARELALNNDLAGLSKELADNAAITEAFASGNRIQQEAAAQALGLQRDQLAKIALQQDYNKMSAEEFKNTYGEVTYQSLQSQSASEKFEATLEKIQGIIGDIGTVFAPILDGFAALVGYLAESKVGAALLVGVMTTLAGIGIATAIANIAASLATLGPVGIPLGIAAAAGLMATIASAVSNVQSVEDGIAPPDRGPFTITDAYGKIGRTTEGDGLGIVASPNVNKGGGSNSEVISLLRTIASKEPTLSMDGRKLNDSMNTSTVSYSIGI